MNKTLHYIISPVIARDKGWPTSFVAASLKETPKAVYVYGHGELDPFGACARCGRKLTHPGSILIGIGPECLGDWSARDYKLDNLTDHDVAYLKSMVREKKVDGWIPKSCIKEEVEVEEKITAPTNHPMLQPLQPANGNGNARSATLTKYQDSGRAAIKIAFPFNQEDLAHVKSLPGRRFHNEGAVKYWTCPLSVDAVEGLQYWGFKLAPELLAFLAKTKISVNEMPTDTDIPGLRMPLYPFQRQGVAFIDAKDGRALIGDEMGLGKTAQALAWLQLHPEKRPAVVVVPASLKLNWEREAMMWMENPNVQILYGSKGGSVPLVGDIIIINYDILPNTYEKYKDAAKKVRYKEMPETGWVDFLKKIKPAVVIIDEIHFTKSSTAFRTKGTKALTKNVPHVIGLSGTPIVNRPREAVNAIQMIDPYVFPNTWGYLQRYCGATHNGFGWDFTGATNTEELHQKLTQTIMLRRLKKEVLTELPDKSRAFLPMELSNSKEYKLAETSFVSWYKEEKKKVVKKNAEALVKIEALKQLAVAGKLKQAVDWIKNFLEIDGKLVVFATHRATVDRLMEEFSSVAVKVDGSVSGADRDAAVQAFQNNDKVRLFVGNIKAAGVGLTLTAASNVAILELPWTPGDLSQAEDRCHRIGQKNAVNIHYLLAAGTIEERIARLLDSKQKVLDAVLDGRETGSESLLSALLSQYEEE